MYVVYYVAHSALTQAGFLPPLDHRDLDLFSASELILQDFYRGQVCFKARDLQDLIQQVLYYPDFDPADVDHDMHE